MAVPERSQTVQQPSDLHIHSSDVSGAADRSSASSNAILKLLKSAHEYIDESDLARAIERFPQFDPKTNEGMSGLVMAAAFEKLRRDDNAWKDMTAHWQGLADQGEKDGTDYTSDVSNELEASQP